MNLQHCSISVTSLLSSSPIDYTQSTIERFGLSPAALPFYFFVSLTITDSTYYNGSSDSTQPEPLYESSVQHLQHRVPETTTR